MEETDEIMDIFTEQNVKIESQEHIYRLLEMDTFINKTNVIFYIKVPMFDVENYKLAHTIPIPLNKTKYLQIPNYILFNKDVLKSVKEKCDKVHEQYICKSKLEDIPNGDERCLRSIANADLAVCDAVEVDDKERILEPEKGKIFVLNRIRSQIHSNCMKPFQVTGNAIITYKDCNLTINGFTYDNAETTQ